MPITVQERLPTVSEYLALRKSVGWPLFPEKVVEEGLSRTLFGVCAMDEGKIVGMGRVIGDNAIYFHIQDVVITPSYQRSGVGKLIMRELMEYVSVNARSNANVGLMCSKGREQFYENLGFTARPSEKFGAGMIKIVE